MMGLPGSNPVGAPSLIHLMISVSRSPVVLSRASHVLEGISDFPSICYGSGMALNSI